MTNPSENVECRTDDGIAAVSFAFPGDGVNPLDLPRLRAIVQAATEAARRPDVEVVIVESGHPGGFCSGFVPDIAGHLATPADRVAFAAEGQRLLAELADLPVVTLAWVLGPCRGPGFELALACDHAGAVATPDSWLGFDDDVLPAWGQANRLRHNPGVVTAREAVRRGIFADAVCARRDKIERRQWLDRLQARPHKPRRRAIAANLLAAERRRFVATPVAANPRPVAPPLPACVGVVGNSVTGSRVVTEAAICGRFVAFVGDLESLESFWNDLLKRGRVTPLELAQARSRITSGDFTRADWLVVADGCPVPRVKPGAVVSRGSFTGPAAGWARLCGVDAAPEPRETPPARIRVAAGHTRRLQFGP